MLKIKKRYFFTAMGLMNNKPKIIRAAVIIWIIIGILLTTIAIYSIYLELEFQKDVYKSGVIISEINLFRDTLLIKNTAFRLIPAILSFIFAIGTYLVKKWAWLWSLILTFYILLVYLNGLASDIQNAVIVGYTDYPFYNTFISIISIIIFVSVIVIFYIYTRQSVRDYFNITY